MSLIESLGRPLRVMASLALPPRCPGCGVPVAEDHHFCAACWSSLQFVAPPWCAGCGLPFAFDRGEEARCGACLADPPRHAGVRAAVAYGEIARTLALKLKYGRKLGVAATMAYHMARLVPGDAELLVPVPLHRWRLWSRGYNQAALVAVALAERSGVACDVALLTRRRTTVPLKGLGRRQRARVVAGAFAIHPARREAVRGRAVVLVDDVFTTGATANACCHALLAAGARSVTILCWARVIAGGD